MDVQSYMSTDLVTIQPSTKIIEALDLMKEHKIHRLPVVQGETIVGLITEGIIERNTPSSMTSLDMHEVNYLLNKTTVADIMEKRVVTINKEALLEEAAVTMRENGISVLPVVVPGNRLIGIITEKDIFSAFIDVLGYYTPGVRVVVNIHEDKKGVLEDLTDIFSDENINSQQIATYRKMGYVQVVNQLESKDIDGIRARLEEHGYEIGSIIYKPERA